jgi:ABC-type multidrug transport system fused ATPase/permease subunit
MTGIEKFDVFTLSSTILFVFVAKFFLGLYANYLIISFSLRQQLLLRTRLAELFFINDYKTMSLKPASHFVEISHRLVEQFSAGVLLPILRIIGDGLVLTGIIILLMWESPLVVSTFVPILIIIILVLHFVFGKKSKYYGELTNELSVEVLNHFSTAFNAMLELKVYGRHSWAISKISKSADLFGVFYGKILLLNTIPKYILELFLIITFLLIIIFNFLVGQDLVAIAPTIGVFIVAALRVLPIVSVLINSLIQISYGRDCVNRLCKELLTLENIESVSLPEQTKLNSLSAFKKIEFQDISFKFDSKDDCVFSNLNLTIRRGEIIGIVGSSGSGKTTLVNVLLGVLKYNTGKVIVDGKEFEKWNASVLSETFAYVPQTPFIFAGSVKENISLEDEQKIDKQKLIAAYRAARLDDVFETKKYGLNYKLADMGKNLSGGQRQRVALARAFYIDRPIIVLDESTNAVDTKTEDEIVSEIIKMKSQGISFIVITHNQSLHQYFDQVINLE